MPTYRNDGNSTYNVENIYGKVVSVIPGASVGTNFLLTNDGNPWTKTNDTPYYNPVLAVYDEIASTGSDDPTTIELNDNTDQIEVYNNSGANIDILLNDSNNTPGYPVPASTKRDLIGVKDFVGSIILQFSAAVSSGEVFVTEKEE